jgi:hypothetical protein
MTHSCAIHLLGGVAARPPPLVPQALLDGRPVVEFPLCAFLGAVEVRWRGHGRDRSGATNDKAPSSWIKGCFGFLLCVVLSCVMWYALDACVL